MRVIRLLLSDGEVEAALDLLDQWLEVGSEASEAMKALIGAVTLAASAADQTTMLEYDLERLIRRGVVTPATLIDVWENVLLRNRGLTGSLESTLTVQALAADSVALGVYTLAARPSVNECRRRRVAATGARENEPYPRRR